MEFRIIETQEVKELTYYSDYGVDCAQELIGNMGDLHYNWDNEEYEMEWSFYEWWLEYFTGMVDAKAAVKDYAVKKGICTSLLWGRIHKDMYVEMEDEPGYIMMILERIMEEIEDGTFDTEWS